MRKTIIRRAIEEFKKYWAQKGASGNIIPFPVTKPGNDDKDDKEQK